MKSRSFWRFFFNDTATAEIYTLSLHDALPICLLKVREIATAGKKREVSRPGTLQRRDARRRGLRDRKSTRLNSSHSQISYAVFCLKKKTERQAHRRSRCMGQARCSAAPGGSAP